MNFQATILWLCDLREVTQRFSWLVFVVRKMGHHNSDLQRHVCEAPSSGSFVHSLM